MTSNCLKPYSDFAVIRAIAYSKSKIKTNGIQYEK